MDICLEHHSRDVAPLSLPPHDKANETELSKNGQNFENLNQKQRPKSKIGEL